jgi:hypothetical protein
VSKRTASLLAWSMWALSLALTAFSLLLLALTLSHPGVPIYSSWLEETLIAMGCSTVGAVVASRRPENTIGWLFCIVGLLFAVDHFCAEYGIYTLLASPGAAPAGEMIVWVTVWLWVPTLAVGVFLLLLFPDGRLPGSAWRWFARLCMLLVVIGSFLAAFSPGPLVSITSMQLQNPLGIDSLPNREVVVISLQALLFALMLVAAGSMFVRMRRARGVERQQIKWVAYAAVATASGAILARVVSRAMDLLWLEWVGSVILIVGVMGIPISMGVAILRYRLYEIDLIINRTLVYGALTATLAVVYFVDIVVFQEVFRALTGQTSQLAIVASTLMIAALFNPLRRRLQAFIDSRFYRRTYDARKVLEAFGSRLRDQTDLEKLCEDLAEVVDETMQPSHISLWLRFPSFSPNSSESSSEVRSSMQSEPPPQ